jgi:hypothetical protein
MKTQATVQWRDMPQLYITLEHEGMRVTVHADGIWPVLKPHQISGTNFLYRLKDGSVIDIWQMDKSNFDIWTMSEEERNAPLTKVVNDYLPELWEVFGHRAEPFTPREEWLPGILEQL